MVESRDGKRGCVCATGFLALAPAFRPELFVERPREAGLSPGSFLLPCSVQTAVINVFKGGGLQSNELYVLNENIRYVQARPGVPVGLSGTEGPPHQGLTLSLVFCLVLVAPSAGSYVALMAVKF